jgi:vancomycin resistance protein YoaR
MGLLDALRAHKRGIAQGAVLLSAGVGIGILLLPPAPERPDPKAPVPDVVLVGQPLDARSEGALERAMERVRTYAAGSLVLKLPGGKTKEIPRASLGAEIDRAYLAQLVAEVRDPSSPLRRARAGLSTAGPVKLPSGVLVNAPKALTTLLSIKDELDAPPTDARLDLASRKLVPEAPGFRVDVYGTLARIDDAFARGLPEVEAAAEVIEPNVKASDLGNVTFDEVLGYFETRYVNDRKREARTYNLRLAASKLDGHVVLPGQVFDFNKTVGPRNEAAGYRVATVIASGELVDGIGGGTCQISGTLYAASFFAGVEILARTPHTRPSAYIKMGLDAAVAYPTINYKFRNSLPYPIVIHETVKDGVVRAEILGPKRTQTVTFVRKIDEVIPFQEVERPDPKVPEGKKVLAQRGVPGFKLHRYRIARDGAFAVRERWSDTYPPTNQIIRVGTGTDKDLATPEDDQHAEYTADEYLTVTQGPDIRSAKNEAGGGMSETRDPGKTGEIGWTQKAGMSHWESGRRSEDDAGDGGGKKTSGDETDKSDKSDKSDKADKSDKQDKKEKSSKDKSDKKSKKDADSSEKGGKKRKKKGASSER